MSVPFYHCFLRNKMWTYLLLSTLLLGVNGYHNEPCSKYGCPLAPPIHVPFVPAPPGHTPRCAKPGLTFCESLEQYPQQLIKFLIDKRTIDFERFLRDESLEDFSSYRYQPEYEYGYDYPKPKVPHDFYPQTAPVLHQPQLPVLHYNVPLNATPDRHLPPANASPFISQGTSFELPQGFGYQPSSQLRPQYHAPVLFNPNDGPWNPRNSRRVLGQQQLAGHTRYRNPLLEFATGPGARAKRQSDSNSISLCPTRTAFVVPKAALNNQGNWMFVVNLEKQTKYSQLVRSEVCMSDTCDGLCSLPLGYTSKCQQQYVQKRLVALEGSGNRLYTDVFWFPHGCTCQVMLDY